MTSTPKIYEEIQYVDDSGMVVHTERRLLDPEFYILIGDWSNVDWAVQVLKRPADQP